MDSFVEEFLEKLKNGDVEKYCLIASYNNGTSIVDFGGAKFNEKCEMVGMLQTQVAFDMVAVNMKHLLKK